MVQTIGLRERKNARTREAITRAALELTLELGFERATIAQIAERADVSPRTVHQWFRSKEEILQHVVASGRRVQLQMRVRCRKQGGNRD